MIREEKGITVMKGSVDELSTDFKIIIMEMYDIFKKKYTEEKAEKKLLEMTKEGIEFRKVEEKGELEELLAKKLHAKIDEMFHLLSEEKNYADR